MMRRSAAVKAPIDILGLSNGARSGLTGFVAGLARKVAQHNVTINNLLPGPFDTDRLRANLELRAKTSGKPVEELRKAQMSADILLGRVGTVQEVAALLCFLMSEDAGYITAATYDINGGLQIS